MVAAREEHPVEQAKNVHLAARPLGGARGGGLGPRPGLTDNQSKLIAT